MCLTGTIAEQILPVAYGQGANGKNTYWETLSGLMGDYAGEAPPDLLIERITSEHACEVADLFGKRLAIASETKDGDELRTQMVKRLTGNSRIKARFMRCDFFEFDRTFKIILMTNHKPVIREKSNAIWRRIKLIPFSVIIPDHEQDKSLGTKLKDEWPGILNWLVAGCLEWQEFGLMEPKEVISATANYKNEQRPLDDFFEECCSFRSNAITPGNILRDAYDSWSEFQPGGTANAVSPQVFNNALRERGCRNEVQWYDSKSQRVWIGVDLSSKNTELL